MPLVRTYLRPGVNIDDVHLGIVCEEIVPAAYHTEEHPLTPGSIQFVPPVRDCSGLKDHVFVETEGFLYEERVPLLTGDDAERPPQLRAAFEEIFPAYTFAVWPKLVTAGYDSDSIDEDFDGDMSMEAAIERVQTKLGLIPSGGMEH